MPIDHTGLTGLIIALQISCYIRYAELHAEGSWIREVGGDRSLELIDFILFLKCWARDTRQLK